MIINSKTNIMAKIIEGVIKSITSKTVSSMHYNVALKMPMSSSETFYALNIDNEVFVLDSLCSYPSGIEVEEGNKVKLFEVDEEDYFLGDISVSDEEIIKSYEMEISSDNWGIGIFFIFIILSAYPVLKVSEWILDIDSIALSAISFLLFVGGFIIGLLFLSYGLGRMIVEHKERKKEYLR